MSTPGSFPRTHEYRADGSLILSSDVIITHPFKSKAVKTAKRITCVQTSPCGDYVAVGDILGSVSIRPVLDVKLQILCFNTGTGRVSAMAWHRSRPNTIFVASANGHINCVHFDGDLEDPQNSAAVKVTGLVTSLKVNESGTQIAVSFGYSVILFALPFKALKEMDRLTAPPVERFGGSRVPLDRLVLDNWRKIPVRAHPRPLGVEYIGDHNLCIAFFSKFEVYDTSSMSEITMLYRIDVPDGSAVGSFAISPNGEYIAATNIKTGIDWYSTNLKQHISQTFVRDSYDKKSLMMPVAFITDSTVVCGHHRGFLAVVQHGHNKVRVLGELGGPPAQYVSVTITPEIMLVAVGIGMDLVVHPLPLTAPPRNLGQVPTPQRPTSSTNSSVSGSEKPIRTPSRSPSPPTTPKTESSMYVHDTPTPPPRRPLPPGYNALGLEGDGSPRESQTGLPDINLNREGSEPRRPLHALPPPPTPPPPPPLRRPVLVEPERESFTLVDLLKTTSMVFFMTWKSFLAIWRWNPKVAIVVAGLVSFICVSTTVKTLRWGQAILLYTPQLPRATRASSMQWEDALSPVHANQGADPEPRVADDGEGEFEEDLDVDGEDTRLVLTETKVVTVTRTVTKTVTATSTVTMSDTASRTLVMAGTSQLKRNHKGRRSQGK